MKCCLLDMTWSLDHEHSNCSPVHPSCTHKKRLTTGGALFGKRVPTREEGMRYGSGHE